MQGTADAPGPFPRDAEMQVQAELSLYALGESDLLPAIYEFLGRLEREGLTVDPGPMSTVVAGPASLVFEAIGHAYQESAARGRRVMVCKVQNLGRREMGTPEKQ